MSLPSYPIVHIPPALTAAIAAQLPALTRPAAVRLPRYPVREGLSPPKLITGALLFTLTVWLFLQELSAGAALSAVAMGLAWQWSHLRSRNRYRLEVGNYEDEFQRYLDYPDLLRQYEMDLTAQTQAGVAAQHQARRVAEVLAAVRLPFRVVPPATFVPQQGRSEAVFARFLKQHFGEDQLYFNRRVRIDDLRTGMDWYYPDVVYRDESGLCVDLEIDEPYVWSTGEPHHYIGQDDLRNGFFISKNWVVLRFTEEQVMRTPLACCQVLAALVFHLTGRDFTIRQHLERPVAQPQWDWVEAKRLASQASRATYSSRRNG